MIKFGRELEFISLIKRDGSGVIPLGTTEQGQPKTDDVNYLDSTDFELRRLSFTHNTFVASAMNTWVVKLKKL